MIGFVISTFGFMVSVSYATKIWKTKGTVWFISGDSATPGLDETENEKKQAIEENTMKKGSR